MAPDTARLTRVAVVSRTWVSPSISSPASATGICGGAKETGISILGSDGTSSAVRSAGGNVPGGIPAYR